MAAENLMLAADALGVGSCYLGQGWAAFADPYGQEILAQWAIPGDHYAVCQVLLGYPRPGDPPPTPQPPPTYHPFTCILRLTRPCFLSCYL